TDTSVLWDVNGIAGGNAAVGAVVAGTGNSNAATYTAPLTLPAGNPISVRARSNADPNISATALVTLTGGVAVTLTPTSATLSVTHRQTFTAQVFNPATPGPTWQGNGIAGGNTAV